MTVFALALLLAVLPSGPAWAASPWDAPRVTADRPSFDPAKNDAAVYSFRLPADAVVSLVLYDLSHRRVRTLLDAAVSKAGSQSAVWRGETDGGGRAGAGQAYYPVLTVQPEGGPPRVWDPALSTGGEALSLSPMDWRYDRTRAGVAYTLGRSARVRIRAGVHGGPLLRTLLEWAPRTAGNQFEPWTGMDDANAVDVAANKGFSLVVDAYSLPDSSVIVEGEPGPSSSLPEAKTGQKDLERAVQMKQAVLQSKRLVEPHYLNAEALDTTPGFRIDFVGTPPGPTPLVTGRAVVKVTLDGATAQRLLRDRFEIIVYVDMERVFEEEQAYSPYNVEFSTGGFATGEHLLSVSVASLTDHISTVSARFKVQR